MLRIRMSRQFEKIELPVFCFSERAGEAVTTRKWFLGT